MPKDKKKKESIQPTKKDFEAPGFFGKVKMFFQGVAAKIAEAFVHVKQWFSSSEDSINAQEAARVRAENEQRGWASSAERIEYTRTFPGYNELSMSEDGLVRIDAKAAAWHPLSEKKHYLDCIHQKFPVMPNPLQTHNGEFISVISTDIFRALQNGREQTFIYAIADNLITAECKNGECILTIGNDKEEQNIVLTEDSYIQQSIAKLFTEHLETPDEVSYLIDHKHHVRYAQWKNEAGSYDTYTIENYHPHVNDYNEKAFIMHKKPVPGIFEIKGPGIFPRHFIDSSIQVEAEMQQQDFRYMITAIHESIFKHPGYQSTFVTKDKVFWLTQDGDKIMAHVAPTQCRHKNVPTIDVEIRPEALAFSRDGAKSLSKTFDHAIKQLNKKLERLDELEAEAKEFTNPQPETPTPEPENIEKANTQEEMELEEPIGNDIDLDAL